MSDAIWFVVKGHEEDGPFNSTQLDSMVRSGRLSNTQELRRKGDVKRYTVEQALVLKRQIQKNKVGNHIPTSTMTQIYESTAFRVFLLFLLLICVGGAALYFTELYREDPWYTWLKWLGLDIEPAN